MLVLKIAIDAGFRSVDRFGEFLERELLETHFVDHADTLTDHFSADDRQLRIAEIQLLVVLDLKLDFHVVVVGNSIKTREFDYHHQ